MTKIMAKSKELAESRVRQGHTVKSLSEKCGITNAGLHGIENGDHGVSPSTAQVICTALNKEFDDIFEIVEG